MKFIDERNLKFLELFDQQRNNNSNHEVKKDTKMTMQKLKKINQIQNIKTDIEGKEKENIENKNSFTNDCRDDSSTNNKQEFIENKEEEKKIGIIIENENYENKDHHFSSDEKANDMNMKHEEISNFSKGLDSTLPHNIKEKITSKYESNSKDIKFEIKQIILKYSKLIYNDKIRDSVTHILSLEEFMKNYADNNYIENIKKLKKEHHLEATRGVRGDGNCLYRSYIFSYLEMIIILSKTEGYLGSLPLKKMFNDIYNTNFYLEKYLSFQLHFIEMNENINNAKMVSLSLLKMIIKMIDDNKFDLKDIYKFFLLNYAKNKLFDNLIISWLRSHIVKYLESRCFFTLNNDLHLHLLVGYFEQNVEEEYRKYLEDKILKYGEEGETIINNIFPFLFGISVNLYNLTKDRKNKEKFDIFNENISPDNFSFDYDNEEEMFICNQLKEKNVSIKVFRRENHYDLIYDKSSYTQEIYSIERNMEKFELDIDYLLKLFN